MNTHSTASPRASLTFGPADKDRKMERVLEDNALLRDITRLQDVERIYKAIGVAGLYGVAIGAVWFLCVAFRAGVLA